MPIINRSDYFRRARSVHVSGDLILSVEKTTGLQLTHLPTSLFAVYAQVCFERYDTDLDGATVVTQEGAYILKRQGGEFKVIELNEKDREQEKETDLAESRS